jgi:hypothetical protein
MEKPHREFRVGDEIMYSSATSIRYGTIVRLLGGASDNQMIEIEFEDGRKEMKKSRDRSLRLLKRRQQEPDRRAEYHDREAQEVRRSEIKRR